MTSNLTHLFQAHSLTCVLFGTINVHCIWYSYVIEADGVGTRQEVESNQSCYEPMKTYLKEFVKADRELLECLKSHCRLHASLSFCA